MEQRIEFIDLAKGICILLVVLIHVFGETSGEVIQMMILFRMPLYFILSGLFFKTYEGVFCFFKKKVNKLIIPFFCSYLFVLPTNYILNRFIEKENDFLFFVEFGRLNLEFNGVSWFLICLFIVNLYFYIMFILCRHNIKWISLCTCICGIVGYSLNTYGFYLPMWMDTSLTVMPFFLFGYAMRKYSNILYGKFSSKSILCFIGSLSILLVVHYYIKYTQNGIVGFDDNNFDIGILPLYIGGLSGTCCVLMVAKYFTRLPVFSYIGRYSIVVLLTHMIYLFVFRNILYHWGIDQSSYFLNSLVFIIIVILSLPTIKFCVRFLPYCFAQKDLWK